MEPYSIVLSCVVGLLAYNEMFSLKRIIRNQERRLNQLENSPKPLKKIRNKLK